MEEKRNAISVQLNLMLRSKLELSGDLVNAMDIKGRIVVQQSIIKKKRPGYISYHIFLPKNSH